MNKLLALVIVLIFGGCVNRLSPEEELQSRENSNQAQRAVTNWIRKYAQYPESYEPVSFSGYSESVSKRKDKKLPDTETYVIKHTHNLLDRDSNMSTFTGYFIMGHDYSVNIIEIERSNSFGGAFPSRTQIWTNKFGRALNRKDSLELEKQRQQVNGKMARDLKGGIESGDLQMDDPNDMDKLRNLLDSLEKQE